MTRNELQAKLTQLEIPYSVQTVGAEDALAVTRPYWGLINDFPSLLGVPSPSFTPSHAVWTEASYVQPSK